MLFARDNDAKIHLFWLWFALGAMLLVGSIDAASRKNSLESERKNRKTSNRAGSGGVASAKRGGKLQSSKVTAAPKKNVGTPAARPREPQQINLRRRGRRNLRKGEAEEEEESEPIETIKVDNKPTAPAKKTPRPTAKDNKGENNEKTSRRQGRETGNVAEKTQRSRPSAGQQSEAPSSPAEDDEGDETTPESGDTGDVFDSGYGLPFEEEESGNNERAKNSEAEGAQTVDDGLFNIHGLTPASDLREAAEKANAAKLLKQQPKANGKKLSPKEQLKREKAEEDHFLIEMMLPPPENVDGPHIKERPWPEDSDNNTETDELVMDFVLDYMERKGRRKIRMRDRAFAREWFRNNKTGFPKVFDDDEPEGPPQAYWGE